MTQISGKTIYILGAGASSHTGAPLLSNFLITARHLLESNQSLIYKSAFESVFEWIDGLRSSAYYVELNLDNLEHIFSIAEMMSQIGLSEGEKYCDNLRKIISETLDKCQLEHHDGRIYPDTIYRTFSENLKELNENRMHSINGAFGSFEKDTVITFNYDVMLDYSMHFSGIPWDYCLKSPPKPDHFKLLKLHGSNNWAYCSDCDLEANIPDNIQEINPTPLGSGKRLSPGVKNGSLIPFKMVTEVLKNAPCNICNKSSLVPFSIPPTWSKNVLGLPIATVWKQAVEEIKNAAQIIVIGYSLPQTDTFFQYLLTLGLSKNPHLHRVVVVDINSTEQFKNRYRSVFSRNLDDRGKLKFWLGETFANFVNKKMRNIGSQIEWQY